MSEPEETYTVKEVIADLKGDLVGRFDKVDTRLESIDRRVDTTATKEDVREVSQRVDGLERAHDLRISSLEDWRVADRAVAARRTVTTTTQRWAIGIGATCAAALVAGLIEAHIW